MQTDLFTPPPCPCGNEPVTREDGQIILWCFCMELFDSLADYLDWLAGSAE